MEPRVVASFWRGPEHPSVIVSVAVSVKVGVSVVTRSHPFESSWSVTVTRSVTVSVKYTSISATDSSSQARSQRWSSRAVGMNTGTPTLAFALVSLLDKVGSGLMGVPGSSIGDAVALVNEG